MRGVAAVIIKADCCHGHTRACGRWLRKREQSRLAASVQRQHPMPRYITGVHIHHASVAVGEPSRHAEMEGGTQRTLNLYPAAWHGPRGCKWTDSPALDHQGHIAPSEVWISTVRSKGAAQRADTWGHLAEPGGRMRRSSPVRDG
jgi:hypothetical protein